MQLKTLLFNRGMYIQNARNVGWLGIAYFICLFFAVPLQILMIASNNTQYKLHFAFTSNSLFGFSEGFQYILMFTVPVLLAIFLFRFMQVKLSADFIHSLPLKRKELFHQNFVFGLVILVIPVIVTSICILLLGSIIDAPTILNVSVLSNWAATTILINSFVFSATVFVGMFTGISVLQGVLTYILLVFPAGVTFLFFMNVKYFLHGFAVDYYLHNQLDSIMPFVRVSNFRNEPLTTIDVTIFMLLTIIAYAIALWAYHKRKVETATSTIAFRPLQPVFLYGVTFCTMLLGGLYFGETQGTLGWHLFGYLSASIIGYFVALMILEKTWRVLTKWKGYTFFVVVMVVIAFFIKIDITGYENRIPALENVERVYLAEGIYTLDERRHKNEIINPYAENYYYKDHDNIASIIKLHEQVAKTESRFNAYGGNYRQVVFAYELTNGKKVVRQYRVPQTFYTEPNDLYATIVNSQEYKWNVYGVLRINDPAKIDKISIISTRGIQHLTLTKKEDIESFHKTFQTELIEETIDEITMYKGQWASVEYLLNNDQRVYSTWNKSHDKVEQWLKERDLIKQARITAENITYAVVIKRDLENYYEYMRTEETMRNFETRSDAIKITDKDQIEQCLKASSWEDQGEYVIAYYGIEGHSSPMFETIYANQLPEFLKNKLQ